MAAGDISAAVAQVGPAVVTLRAERQEGAGFVFNDKGNVLTNAHVVGAAKTVAAKFGYGSLQDAQVIAVDQGRDLAILQLPTPPKQWAQFGSAARVKPGEDVAALGAPLGLENSVTKGIISSRDRRIGNRHFLQIDAALNPGNSGGPVVDARGAVIGVSTVVAERAQNIGFAVPSETIVAFLNDHQIAFATYPGDTVQPEPAATPGAAPQPGGQQMPPLGEPTPLSLPVIIAIAVVASVITSAVTCLLILRVTLLRATQRLAARSVAPGTPRVPAEDLADVDITLD